MTSVRLQLHPTWSPAVCCVITLDCYTYHKMSGDMYRWKHKANALQLKVPFNKSDNLMCRRGQGVHNRPNVMGCERCPTRTQTSSIESFLHLDSYNTCWLNSEWSDWCSLVTPPICKGDKLKSSIKMWSMPESLWLKRAPWDNEAIIQLYCAVNEWWTFERTQEGFPVNSSPLLHINLKNEPTFNLYCSYNIYIMSYMFYWFTEALIDGLVTVLTDLIRVSHALK